MKRLSRFMGIMLSVLLIMVTAFGTGMFEKTTSVSAASSSGFYVSGTKLYDANGNQFIMRGVNYPHAWYTGYYTKSLAAIKNAGANCVRIVLSDGDTYSKTSSSEVSALISACKENKLVAILDIHDATGSDSKSLLDNAVNYWISIKDKLIGNEAYVILNIANEWYGTWNSSGWYNGYASAIPKLRAAGIKNTLMVDCGGWGQYPQSIADYGTSVLSADSLGNTMFSIHMYEYAGGDATTVKNNIDSVLNKGLCLTIGEFGGYHTNGDVDEDTIMSYCQSKSVGWMAWSWAGNSSSLSFLNLCNDFEGNSRTTWGNRVIYGTNGLKATASVCSIFSSGSSSSGSSSSRTVYYKIVNKNSGKCLTPYGFGASNGTKIVQASYEANTGQQWYLVDCGNGYYMIKNRYSGLVMDITGKSTSSGAYNILYSQSGNTNQQFAISDLSGGYGTITNRNSGLVLDISGKSTANNAYCIQYTNNGGSNQLFQFVQVS